ncbi:hypothetical protein HSIEG1_1360 [Enterococcus sp. HSIEG1]|nr:hypothetical protein HSIEG1_1360 [Enterococcus sp. HSIEG1]
MEKVNLFFYFLKINKKRKKIFTECLLFDCFFGVNLLCY